MFKFSHKKHSLYRLKMITTLHIFMQDTITSLSFSYLIISRSQNILITWSSWNFILKLSRVLPFDFEFQRWVTSCSLQRKRKIIVQLWTFLYKCLQYVYTTAMSDSRTHELFCSLFSDIFIGLFFHILLLLPSTEFVG